MYKKLKLKDDKNQRFFKESLLMQLYLGLQLLSHPLVYLVISKHIYQK